MQLMLSFQAVFENSHLLEVICTRFCGCNQSYAFLSPEQFSQMHRICVQLHPYLPVKQ